ncbi:MAG: helix-turn-helix transcriptional regulator, partial [Verrucomicrobiota bacterium]
AFAVRDPLVAKALCFISEHCDQPLKVADVARGVSVSLRTLQRVFQEEDGLTIRTEIERFRVERLKRLLVQTDRPVKDLAYAVGFRDAARMTKVFARAVGLSPTAYRKEHGRSR